MSLKVFLCHASQDKEAVRRLYARLHESGYAPWLDEEDILPGQDWDHEIRKAVKAADVVAVCLSQHSALKSGYVQREIQFALDIAEEQPEGKIFLIPVKLEECSVPERLRRWQWVNLFSPDGYDRLCRGLEHCAKSKAVQMSCANETPRMILRLRSDETHLTERFVNWVRAGKYVPYEPETYDRWNGHWIFNTNETHAPGAYEQMFHRFVAAIYGYPNGPRNLEGAAPGNTILAYVNRQGLRAIGVVVDGKVKPGEGIFLDSAGNQLPDEYHLSVAWQTIVPAHLAISSQEAVAMGYNLPVRSVFAKLHNGKIAAMLEQELRIRATAGAPT
jgi:hypothetical protein